jgi:hypothetical protein
LFVATIIEEKKKCWQQICCHHPFPFQAEKNEMGDNNKLVVVALFTTTTKEKKKIGR